MTEQIFPQGDSQSVQFCRLKYVPRGLRDSSSHESPIVFVALKFKAGRVQLFVHRDWTRFLAAAHQEYFTDLIEDFKQRIERDPDALFDQLSRLRNSFLVVERTGAVAEQDVRLSAWTEGFDRIQG